MVRALATAMAALTALAAGSAAAATRLVVTSRPSRGSARLAYSSTDALAGLDKGAGTDRATISADVYLRQSGASTTFSLPAGAYAGDAGWLVNDAARALFSNRRAPVGPTGVMRAVFATGRRVKISTKSLGDGGALALSAAPDTAVEIAWVVTNGAETRTHCARFAPTACTWLPLDGGTGWKLRCSGGTADLACGAKPTCGNGIREPGEQCDGGALCTPQCLQGMASCCQGVGQCIAAPVFSLQYYLMQYCNIYGEPRPGLVCQPDGSCADEGIETVPVCCQQEGPSCYQQSAGSVAQLWYDQYYCLGGSGIGGLRHIVINATCGADGSCVPE